MAEDDYRKGYTQGWAAAVSAIVDEGHPISDVEKHLAELHNWRAGLRGYLAPVMGETNDG